ncbi:MAG: hypothetical protein ACOC6F_03590, partial [bacterium]
AFPPHPKGWGFQAEDFMKHMNSELGVAARHRWGPGITYLKRPHAVRYCLCVTIDILMRYVAHWVITSRESAQPGYGCKLSTVHHLAWNAQALTHCSSMFCVRHGHSRLLSP